MVILSATGCFGGQGNVFSLEVGQCFDDPDVVAAEIIDVIIVDCSSPHDNEVYAAFDLAGTVFPGVDEVFDAAHRGCEDRFSPMWVSRSPPAPSPRHSWPRPSRAGTTTTTER
jgi:hypothetical protein